MNVLRYVVVTVFLACAVAGCTNPQHTAKDNNVNDPNVAFTAAELIAQHNARAAMLKQLHAYGVIEIHWTDDHGRHKDQGDAELWIDQPKRTALRVDKIGEVLLWLGSNDQTWWLFDMLNKPTTLHWWRGSPRRDGVAESPIREDDNIISIHPLVLLDLLGITPIAYVEGEGALYDRAAKQWTLRVKGSNAPLQLTFNEAGQLITIAAIDDHGDVIAVSALRDYESVKVSGVNQLNWPKTATHVVITLADQSGSVLLALNNDMEAVVDDAMAARVFDLETIKKSLRPERVETGGAK